MYKIKIKTEREGELKTEEEKENKALKEEKEPDEILRIKIRINIQKCIWMLIIIATAIIITILKYNLKYNIF